MKLFYTEKWETDGIFQSRVKEPTFLMQVIIGIGLSAGIGLIFFLASFI